MATRNWAAKVGTPDDHTSQPPVARDANAEQQRQRQQQLHGAYPESATGSSRRTAAGAYVAAPATDAQPTRTAEEWQTVGWQSHEAGARTPGGGDERHAAASARSASARSAGPGPARATHAAWAGALPHAVRGGSRMPDGTAAMAAPSPLHPPGMPPGPRDRPLQAQPAPAHLLSPGPQQVHTAAAPAGASTGGSQADRLMAEARRSAFDPASNKVHCRACGKAFDTYAKLAQHLAASHDGLNSEDAKYLQLRRQAQAAASSSSHAAPPAPSAADVGPRGWRGGPASAPGLDQSLFPALNEHAAAATSASGSASRGPPAWGGASAGGASAAAPARAAAGGPWSSAVAHRASAASAIGTQLASPAQQPAATTRNKGSFAAAAQQQQQQQQQQHVRPSRKVVTLADLLQGAGPAPGGQRGGRAGAAAAAGGRAVIGGGVAVRVSNSLRLTGVAPRAAPTAGRGASSTAAAGRGGGALEPARAPAKRQRLTAAGTIAAPRKKHLSRTKRLVLQHRSSKALAERAAAYFKSRDAYTNMLQGYLRLQAEHEAQRHAQQQQQQQSLLAAAGVSATDTNAAPPVAEATEPSATAQAAPPEVPATVAVPDAACACADGADGGACSSAAIRQPARQPARGVASPDPLAAIVAAAQQLPAKLRPQLLLLALLQARPRLEALHRAHVSKREAYVEGLRQHARFHKQPEPTDEDLQMQAPLGPPVPPPPPMADGDGDAAFGGGTDADPAAADGSGAASAETAAAYQAASALLADAAGGAGSDDESDDFADDGMFQDVLRRWATALKLPQSLYDFDKKFAGGGSVATAATDAPGAGARTAFRELTPEQRVVGARAPTARDAAAPAVMVPHDSRGGTISGDAGLVPVAAIADSSRQRQTGAKLPPAAAASVVPFAWPSWLAPGGSSSDDDEAADAQVGMANRPAGPAAAAGVCVQPQPQQAPAARAPAATNIQQGARPTPLPGAAAAATAVGGTKGGTGKAAAAAFAGPSWLAPGGDTSSDEDDDAHRSSSLGSKPRAPAAPLAPSALPPSGKHASSAAAHWAGGSVAAAQPGSNSAQSGVHGTSLAPVAPRHTTAAAAAPAQRALTSAASAGGGSAVLLGGGSHSQGQDSSDDDGDGPGPRGWTNVLDSWSAKLKLPAAALPLFVSSTSHGSSSMTAGAIWSSNSNHPFVPAAAPPSEPIRVPAAVGATAGGTAPMAAATAATAAPAGPAAVAAGRQGELQQPQQQLPPATTVSSSRHAVPSAAPEAPQQAHGPSGSAPPQLSAAPQQQVAPVARGFVGGSLFGAAAAAGGDDDSTDDDDEGGGGYGGAGGAVKVNVLADWMASSGLQRLGEMFKYASTLSLQQQGAGGVGQLYQQQGGPSSAAAGAMRPPAIQPPSTSLQEKLQRLHELQQQQQGAGSMWAGAQQQQQQQQQQPAQPAGSKSGGIRIISRAVPLAPTPQQPSPPPPQQPQPAPAGAPRMQHHERKPQQLLAASPAAAVARQAPPQPRAPRAPEVPYPAAAAARSPTLVAQPGDVRLLVRPPQQPATTNVVAVPLAQGWPAPLPVGGGGGAQGAPTTGQVRGPAAHVTAAAARGVPAAARGVPAAAAHRPAELPATPAAPVNAWARPLLTAAVAAAVNQPGVQGGRIVGHQQQPPNHVLGAPHVVGDPPGVALAPAAAAALAGPAAVPWAAGPSAVRQHAAFLQQSAASVRPHGGAPSHPTVAPQLPGSAVAAVGAMAAPPPPPPARAPQAAAPSGAAAAPAVEPGGEAAPDDGAGAAAAPAKAPPLLPPEFLCVLCGVHCNSRWTHEQHISSRRHAAKALAAGLPAPAVPSAVPQVAAGPSGSAAPAAASPIGGQWPQAEGPAGAGAGGAAASGEEAAATHTCTLCGVVCNGDVTFQQHLASKRHMARAARQLLQSLDLTAAAAGAAPKAPAAGGVVSQAGGAPTEGAAAATSESGAAAAAAAAPPGRLTGAAGGPAGVGLTGGGAAGGSGSDAGALPGAAPAAGTSATAAAGAAAASSASAAGAAGSGRGPHIHRLCRQVLVPELDSAVLEMLGLIKGFQERAMAKNAVKAAAHRWYVLGLREAHKAVRTRRARAVIIAPNIEEVSCEGGLDSMLQAITDMCGDQGVPLVFALSRKHMGRVYGFKKRVSAVAVLELNGIHELAGQVARMAREAAEAYDAKAAAAAESGAGAAADGLFGLLHITRDQGNAGGHRDEQEDDDTGSSSGEDGNEEEEQASGQKQGQRQEQQERQQQRDAMMQPDAPPPCGTDMNAQDGASSRGSGGGGMPRGGGGSGTERGSTGQEGGDGCDGEASSGGSSAAAADGGSSTGGIAQGTGTSASQRQIPLQGAPAPLQVPRLNVGAPAFVPVARSTPAPRP